MSEEQESMFLGLLANPVRFRILETTFGWESTCAWLAKYSKSGAVSPTNPTKAQAWLIRAWDQTELPAKSMFYPNIEMWRNIEWQKPQ